MLVNDGSADDSLRCVLRSVDKARVPMTLSTSHEITASIMR